MVSFVKCDRVGASGKRPEGRRGMWVVAPVPYCSSAEIEIWISYREGQAEPSRRACVRVGVCVRVKLSCSPAQRRSPKHQASKPDESDLYLLKKSPRASRACPLCRVGGRRGLCRRPNHSSRLCRCGIWESGARSQGGGGVSREGIRIDKRID